MRILTIGESPYLLTSKAKINDSVLRYLKNKNHEIFSAVWNLDPSWVLKDTDNKFYYEYNNEKICQLFPFNFIYEKSSIQIYEICKIVKPDIILTIGDIQETDFIFAIKSLYPKAFKWINILTLDALPVSKNRIETFDFMDGIITTSEFSYNEIKKYSKCPTEYQYFGLNDNFLSAKNNSDDKKLRIFVCGKNNNSSNLGAVFTGLKENKEIEVYMHTNTGDNGDYDFYELQKRYNTNFLLPEKYVGINDGLPENELINEYCKSDIVVDLSVRSSVGSSLMEGMSCGCIPVGNNGCIIGEILENYTKLAKKELMYFDIDELAVESNEYIGEFNEVFYVSNPENFKNKMLRFKHMKKYFNKKFNILKEISKKLTENYKRNDFLEKLNNLLEVIKNTNYKINVEEL